MEQLRRPKTLAERAVEILRNAIINNEFMLGEPLSENLLAKSIGTSKSPIREALAQLKIEGLVNIIPQKGTFVFTLTQKELTDLMEVRFILESAALRMAIEKSRDRLVQCLQTQLDGMETHLQSGDIDAYLKHDNDFHESLFICCDNQYLRDAYAQISGKSAALRTRITRQPRHPNKTFREHTDILKHVEKGEVEQALEMLKIHFSSFMQFYQENIDQIAVSTVSSTRKLRQVALEEQ